MKRNSRFSVALHVTAHLAQPEEHRATSEVLAAHLQTHPVVVRRTMAGLREAGLVVSLKGHGGGWALARPATDITLAQIYQALGEQLFASQADESPGCLIEAAVNDALDQVHQDAEALLVARLGRITLHDLSTDVHRRFAVLGQSSKDS